MTTTALAELGEVADTDPHAERVITITIPNEALKDARRLQEEALCSAWSQGEVSGGTAAALLGLSRIEFWDMAGGRGYTWPMTVEDLERDVANLKELGFL